MRFNNSEHVGAYNLAQQQYREKLRELMRSRTSKGDEELSRRELLARRYRIRSYNKENSDRATFVGKRFVLDIEFDYDRKRARAKAPGEAIERLTDRLLENYSLGKLRVLSHELRTTLREDSIQLDGVPGNDTFRWNASPNRDELTAMSEELHSVLGDSMAEELQLSLDAGITEEEQLKTANVSPGMKAMLHIE